jgi:hypothetical protein
MIKFAIHKIIHNFEKLDFLKVINFILKIKIIICIKIFIIFKMIIIEIIMNFI